MQSLQGNFLVASPHLKDPNFVGTVVLLVRHDEQGALGVVLNRPADKTLKELWQSVSETPCQTDQRIHVGGPVPGPLMAVHTQPDLADSQILPGVYFAAEKEKLESLVGQTGHLLRVFVGHAGWGGGQLEGELEQGAWLTAPASAEYVFADDTDLWEKVTRHIGKAMLESMLKLKDLPEDPSMN